MDQIFISYAKEDKASANRVYKDLVTQGYKVWLDTKCLIGGQNWEYEIRKAISDSGFFIALISQHSVSKRGYVQSELKQAMRIMELLPENEIFIIPVRLDESKPISESLSRIHWVDLFEDWDSGIVAIERALYLQRPDIKDALLIQDLGPRPVDVNRTIESALVFAASYDLEDKIKVTKNLSPESLLIIAERRLFLMALIKVLTNAYLYTDTQVANPRIQIRSARCGSDAVITVINVGTPVTEEEVSERKCFDPFYMGKYNKIERPQCTIEELRKCSEDPLYEAQYEKNIRTGLGLAVAERIITTLKGAIDLQSESVTKDAIDDIYEHPFVTTITIRVPLAGNKFDFLKGTP